MIKFWAESERFISSFPFFIPCMDFVLKSRVVRAVKKAKELYDITTNNNEQVFTLKSY